MKDKVQIINTAPQETIDLAARGLNSMEGESSVDILQQYISTIIVERAQSAKAEDIRLENESIMEEIKEGVE